MGLKDLTRKFTGTRVVSGLRGILCLESLPPGLNTPWANMSHVVSVLRIVFHFNNPKFSRSVFCVYLNTLQNCVELLSTKTIYFPLNVWGNVVSSASILNSSFNNQFTENQPWILYIVLSTFSERLNLILVYKFDLSKRPGLISLSLRFNNCSGPSGPEFTET